MDILSSRQWSHHSGCKITLTYFTMRYVMIYSYDVFRKKYDNDDDDNDAENLTSSRKTRAD